MCRFHPVSLGCDVRLDPSCHAHIPHVIGMTYVVGCDPLPPAACLLARLLACPPYLTASTPSDCLTRDLCVLLLTTDTVEPDDIAVV